MGIVKCFFSEATAAHSLNIVSFFFLKRGEKEGNIERIKYRKNSRNIERIRKRKNEREKEKNNEREKEIRKKE